ncbi:hypothetical protein K435DRAFT_873796 [Dendrothele bispora CBS 962.96]|uniref:Uncharacterized protein n=1 Tax=Dendrothele bispora (strain CBS 962.96) TaxID=1314807 RepID=A0A4S8KYC1_DENBC|nr:hypothetical protein K435DRAFT_873796 [Dendrothele bispora CBS 962.96]
MSPLTNGIVDESSDMHSKVDSCYSIVVIGSQPAIYLAQGNLDLVLFEGFMGNSFAAGGQRTATVNVEKHPWFPHQNLWP